MRIVKIRRLSTMYEGGYCTLVIDGKTVNRKVYRDRDGLYIKDKGAFYYESALTLGEEVSILWILAK